MLDLNRIAATLFEQHKYSEAVAKLKCSLAQDSKQPRMLKLLGLSAQLSGDPRQAEAAFTSARELDAKDPQAAFFLGRLFYEQNFFDRARKALETAHNLRVSDPGIRHYLGLTLEALGETKHALNHYSEAVRLEKEPERAWRIHLSYGALLHKAGMLRESERELTVAREMNPNHWQPRFELAKLYYALGKLTEADRELTAALKIEVKGEDAEQIRRLSATIRSGKDRGAGSPPPGAAGSFPTITFVKRAQQASVHFVLRNHATPKKHLIETMPGGVAVLDYDNDGFEDIFFVNGATVPEMSKTGPADWNRLYRNEGNGKFSDVSERAGVAGEGYGMGVAVGDYDNDGWQDLFIAGVNRNILYHNNRNGTFSDVTAKSGMQGGGPNKMWSVGAGWFDYDSDGFLDLFVVNYCKWSADKEPFCGDEKAGYRTYCHPRFYEGLPNTLYRNNGDGTFTDVSSATGIAAYVGKGMAVAFGDYDGDGRLDVFVTNDAEPDFLFRNAGDGTFTETGLRAGVAYNLDGQATSSMGADFRDVDDDGRADIIVTTLSNEMFSLFRNSGEGQFENATYSSNLALLTLPWTGWGVGLFDLNNDGYKDIFTANAHVVDNQERVSSRTYKQPNLLLSNLGNARFADARSGSDRAVWEARAHRGCAFGDFDNDGRIDIVVSSLNERAELLLNRSEPRQHWLSLSLTGTRSNRDGIGAHVVIQLPSGRVLHNQAGTAVGYASSSSRRVHFGLGAEKTVARVEIRWPSGTVQSLENVPTDRLLSVTEPAANGQLPSHRQPPR